MHTISAPGGIMKSGSRDHSRSRSGIDPNKTVHAVTSTQDERTRFDTPFPPPLSESSHQTDTLQRLVDRLRTVLRCDAVALRLVDSDGCLSYRAESGYPANMMGTPDECRHRSRQCVCEQVLHGQCDRSLPCCTPGGSFVINSSMDRLSIQRRSTAPSFGHLFGREGEFQSFVIAPIRTLGCDLGVLHCADSQPDTFNAEAVKRIEEAVGEIAHDLYYDSLWQPRSRLHTYRESADVVLCPICGRNRDANGVWQADTLTVLRPDPPPDARPVVCPSCLRLCNFE